MASKEKPANDPRPRSPHIQIYRPQLTSVLSFGHRLSGIGLSIGSIALAVWLIAVASGTRCFDLVGPGMGPALIYTHLFGFGRAFEQHGR